MKQHLEIRLISQAASGGEGAGPGDVFGRKPNGRGRGNTRGALAPETGGRSGAEFALGRGVFEGFGEFVAMVVPPLRFFGFAREFRNSSHPFVGEIKIDQVFGSGKGRDDAQACLPERSDDHEKPPLAGAPNAADAFFALHGLGLDVERVVFNDLLGLFGRNLMASDVTTVGIVPVKTKISVQGIL